MEERAISELGMSTASDDRVTVGMIVNAKEVELGRDSVGETKTVVGSGNTISSLEEGSGGDGVGETKTVVGSGNTISSLEEGGAVELMKRPVEDTDEEVVGEATTPELVSGRKISEVKTPTIEEEIISDVLASTDAVKIGEDEGNGSTSIEDEAVGKGEGAGVGVKMLIERVSSEDDMGISMLFEDDCTRGLENTVLSGIGAVSVSEDRLGVGSMVGSSISEPLKSTSEVAGSTGEVSGISIPLEKSGGIIAVGDSVRTVEVGSADMVGTRETLSVWISVEVSGWSILSELDTGTRGDTCEVVGLREKVAERERRGVVASGIRITSELLTRGDRLLSEREKVERAGVWVRRSSMLDWMVKNREEGGAEGVGERDSERTGRDVRRDGTENIRDMTGIDETASRGPCSELARGRDDGLS